LHDVLVGIPQNKLKGILATSAVYRIEDESFVHPRHHSTTQGTYTTEEEEMSRVKIASHRVHETVQYLYIKRPQRRFFQQSAYCVSSRLEISRGTNRSSSVLSIINSATLFFFFFLIRNTSAANEWIERAALSQFSQ
jgi:hypothetical protein